MAGRFVRLCHLHPIWANKGPSLTFWNDHYGVGMKSLVSRCFLFFQRKKNCKQQSFKILNVIKWGSSRPVHKLKEHFTTVFEIIQSDKIEPMPMRKETKPKTKTKKNKTQNSSHSKMLERKRSICYCLDNNYKYSMGILVFSVLALLSAVCSRCNSPGRQRKNTSERNLLPLDK